MAAAATASVADTVSRYSPGMMVSVSPAFSAATPSAMVSKPPGPTVSSANALGTNNTVAKRMRSRACFIAMLSCDVSPPRPR